MKIRDAVERFASMHIMGNNSFSGLIDEVRIYSRVLTQTEIQADMATLIAPRLVAR